MGGLSCAMISEIAASRMLSPFCTASVRAVSPSIASQASWNPEMRLNELNPNVEEKLSYKYSRLRCPSLARCRTMSLMPSLSLIPTVGIESFAGGIDADNRNFCGSETFDLVGADAE